MKRILIVDDSAVFRKILNLHLSNSDFDILEAVDGQDGLDNTKRQSGSHRKRYEYAEHERNYVSERNQEGSQK